MVFLGTSAFAEPVLQALDAHHEVLAAVTQPDRPAGRGHRPRVSRIKRLALELGIPVRQPERIRRRSAWEPLADPVPDVLVVADYGQILSARLLAVPRLGAVNVHASLLPELRGAAPAIWALARGHRRTGVTTMLMDAGLDTGPILLQRKTAIRETETGGELLARLAPMGAELLIETLAGLAGGRITPRPQDEDAATLAPRIRKADAALDWDLGAPALADRVRAFSPAPVAFTAFQPETPGGATLLRIHRAAAASGSAASTVPPGSFRVSGSRRAPCLEVACGAGTTFRPLEVQAAGRQRLPIADFLRGNAIPPNGRFAGAAEAVRLTGA
ncbi:MAG: methionyl-tRNA formyltransferase [Acidobacteria bacterium]|nr:methionyl-tRNA formyltransferase [Acidobacteriota bacterium]